MPVPLRILVTRPQPSAAATAARLEALGHEAIVLPMMEAVHQPQAAIEALASPHSDIAVTSAEAIRALAMIGDRLTPHLQTRVFCVGRATADAARQVGFQSVITGPGTGSGLAHLIAETSTGLGQGLAYLAGLPRTPAFEAALRDAGIACRVADVYRMSPIAHAPEAIEDLFESRRPDTVLFYSHETARHFFDLVAPKKIAEFQNIRLLCLSDHVAAAVPYGIGKVSVAAAPNEASLFALL
ncbi:uroporphyrinogen-III synthase [Rhizobium herbae]|uniref:Uroporphyrinogen-III synthase n=1 Tax=Rhizobium herbae TaxID=508661 RepID=A0ABS4EKL2_9HYPH|nr:uroporphyrinogen-III synthase [Rhizobium herbae]MBP1858484.1 uroporphyrinogen-III synthase [Rhizobium herbae]